MSGWSLRNRQNELAAGEAESKERLAELENRLKEREARAEREFEAEELLARYREPLAAASFDLQRRLYNIMNQGFLDVYMTPGNAREEEAVESTLFRVAQYLGWTEILRRNIQFLKFREAEVTRAVAKLQAKIARTFATDGHGHDFMLWQDEQRAIGELMIVRQNGSVDSRGYGDFLTERREGQWTRLDRLERDFRDGKAPGSWRLQDLQRQLCELIELLDADELLYERAALKRASRRADPESA